MVVTAIRNGFSTNNPILSNLEQYEYVGAVEARRHIERRILIAELLRGWRQLCSFDHSGRKGG